MKLNFLKNPTALIVIWIFANPALRAANPAESQPVPTIGKSSPGGVVVSSAHGRWVKGRLLVAGVVHRKAGYSYPGPRQSHLDFIVLDSHQRTLSLSQVEYLPRPIPIVYRGIPSQATYAEYLPVTPSAEATVQVAHHEASIGECRRSHPSVEAKDAKQLRSERGK